VFARNTVTAATAAYRADELFPLCSTWKALAASAVPRDLDAHGEVLAERVHWTSGDLVADSPVTGARPATSHGA
jgi:beta-lactamase class A